MPVVIIRQDNVNFTGFTLQNSKISTSSVEVQLEQVGNCKVHGNVNWTTDGIWLNRSSKGNIFDNAITENDYGVKFQLSNKNTISGNNITKNGQGISSEVGEYSFFNSIIGNNIKRNGRGIHFIGCQNNTITGNIIGSNKKTLNYRFNHTIDRNTIADNTNYDSFFTNGKNSLSYRNSFLNNIIQPHCSLSDNTGEL